MTHLPLLPVLPLLPPSADPLDATRIETPCTVPWQSMPGDDRVRFCGHCRQNVYNVSAMAREEALALIHGKEQRVCLRLTRRADGTVVTANCWQRLRQARRRGWLAFAAMMFVLLWAQVIGLVTLSRLIRSRATTGTPAPIVVVPAPPPPVLPMVEVGIRLPEPVMGEAPRPPRKHVRVGQVRRPVPPPDIVMGAPPPRSAD